MNNITKIKLEIVKDTYVCDSCGKVGDITNMTLAMGKGLFHAKCRKELNY